MCKDIINPEERRLSFLKINKIFSIDGGESAGSHRLSGMISQVGIMDCSLFIIDEPEEFSFKILRYGKCFLPLPQYLLSYRSICALINPKITLIHMKNNLIALLCALFFSIAGQAQTDVIVKQINETGFWTPFALWLENESSAESFLRQISYFSDSSLLRTEEVLLHDHERARQILNARDEIIGKTKSRKKQDRKLANYFTNVDVARKIFDKAEETEKLYEKLASAIKGVRAGRKSPTMPSGALKSFSYQVNNGFARYHLEVSLMRKEGKNLLNVEEDREGRLMEHPEEKSLAVEVQDSVFLRVRDMVEEGKLYEVGRRYAPDIMIFDASSWSMELVFEGGSIVSDGYASGPDHSDTLNGIMKYLTALYDQLKEK